MSLDLTWPIEQHVGGCCQAVFLESSKSSCSLQSQSTADSPWDEESGSASDADSDYDGDHVATNRIAAQVGSLSAEESAIIFDWDDTLFPTWYLINVVWPCSPDLDKGAHLPEDSPFHAQLVAHARTVEETLRAARAVAKVGIVTLAARSWIWESAECYLPGLDLHALLEELEISVFYARDYLERRSDDELADPEQPYVAAKKSAMLECLEGFGVYNGIIQNVMSVGDSMIEHMALFEAVWDLGGMDVLCKTLKLMEDPNVQQLTSQLEVMTGPHVASLMKHPKDFSISMDSQE
mmetsp:Transcript_31330/g.79809  ORF Transcript_31330/g.79809 Transcript_31330/m.79809 type:complete len:294 (-) Transcript_31330:169-1050(-)|eukprot:CAMPEP_0195053202 /NCGR_PEP_ID=MMETSP0448-20130528/2434_1 /TAXON_ID=66468 /ORGANISM="Heterocapsa triquestra, Strain CCMP 448" /LENGTH=293 /DNA_ID=CAMNT_0040082475 /DNA_START=40 /DNA_END=921 /DNA_ORIENTATION=-